MNSLSPRAGIGPHSPHTSPQTSTTGLVSSIAILVAMLFLISGCTTTATDRAAKSLASTVQTVDVAMQGYATAVVLQLIDDQDQDQVRKLYADYQAAVAIAEAAITNAINSGDAGRLASAAAALTAARDPLLAFLARFTTSPP